MEIGWKIAQRKAKMDRGVTPGMTDLQFDTLVARLRRGDFLEIKTGGGSYEVWAEPFGNPPTIYYEGEPHPLEQVPEIAAKILERMRSGEIHCRWVAKRDDGFG